MDGLAPLCPYCGKFSAPATGKDIYPHRPDLFTKKFFRCEPCDAFVGTHNRTGAPLGTLANAKLRRLRSLAHASFDPVWKEGGVDRTVAYSMLAKGLGIPFESCHIGMFDEAQCKRVVELCNSREIFHYADTNDNPDRTPGQAADQEGT